MSATCSAHARAIMRWAFALHSDKRTQGQSSLRVGRLLFLTALSAVVACANVCTPVNVPVNGPFPAIVNGIDSVDWGVARVQWTSDATPGIPATAQQIVYATAAEWASSPNVYPHTGGVYNQTITSPSVLQGGILSNLLPATTYHVAGQSFQGGAWCLSTDTTFSTPAQPAVAPAPVLPQSVNTTQPPMNGTHWIYGSNCGASGTVTQKLQDCFTKALPGDDIGLPPGTYPTTQIATPLNPNAVAVSCSTASGTCTQTGSAPPNGTTVIFFQPPAPVNPGVPYTVIHSTGSSFQISDDGVNPIFLVTPGGPANAPDGTNVYYEIWPVTQAKIVIHSTAAANLLPPTGVRLGPDALAQYLPNMPNLQMLDPIAGANGTSLIYFAPLAANYWFQNIAFSTDPSVAANTNQLDPIGFYSFLGTDPANTGITFNQCAFVPAPPPSRSKLITWNGSNMAVTNSYQSGLDWWQPFLSTSAAASFTASSLTIPALTYSWVGSGGSIGTKQSCSNPGGSVSITGGTASGTFYVWMNADCSLSAQFPTGTAATGSNITVSTASTPAYPTYSYTSPTYSTVTRANYSVIPLAPGTLVNGAITSFTENDPGTSAQALESGNGFSMGWPGPFLFDNDYMQGAGIAGIFMSDSLTNQNSPCGSVNLCPQHFIPGNLTQTRSTVTTNPCYFYDSACWNGGNYYWRSVNEVRQGKWVLQDGNVFGPFFSQVSEGECALHETFNGGGSSFPSYPSYADSSEWTFTNNTCLQTASAGITTTLEQNAANGLPIKDILIRNNLFLNDNGWAQTAVNQPFASGKSYKQDSTTACPYGHLTAWGGTGLNFVFDHNTVFGQGGCLSLLDWQRNSLSSGLWLTNNIFNLVNDPGPLGSPWTTGTLYTAWNAADACNVTQGNSMFTCLNSFNWKGNVVLATWTNSLPGSQVEFNSAQISAVQSALPVSYWPSANSLAARIAQIGWFNAATANFRLASNSPYISGSTASSDGLDVGVNMDQLEQHQGKVSNVRVISATSTSATIGFYAPDSFACGVDWGTTPFWSGTGTWTRVSGSGGQRIQSVSLSGLPAHSLIYYRINCAVQQPTANFQLP